MKIAITADLHLHSNHPERRDALEDILQQINSEGISDLIIAGDLFDKDGEDSYINTFVIVVLIRTLNFMLFQVIMILKKVCVIFRKIICLNILSSH